jgi:hypothetical protein
MLAAVAAAEILVELAELEAVVTGAVPVLHQLQERPTPVAAAVDLELRVLAVANQVVPVLLLFAMPILMQIFLLAVA